MWGCLGGLLLKKEKYIFNGDSMVLIYIAGGGGGWGGMGVLWNPWSEASFDD